MTRWIALTMALGLGPMACAPTAPTVEPAVEPAVEPVSAPAASPAVAPSAVLDAQYAAIVAGDAAGAVRAFGAQAVLSGPNVGQVAAGAAAVTRATTLFEALAKKGFEPRHAHRVVGGEDLDTVRWVVDRFQALGRPWVVTTLMSREAHWTIAAQTWDVVESDASILALARDGALPDPPPIDGGGVAEAPALTAWVEMLSRNPTDLTVSAPLRGDTYSLGTAGEYAQSDEAYLATMAQTKEAIAAGTMRFERIPGQVIRLTSDGAAGVAVFHMAVTITDDAGPATLPMRGTIYFLNRPDGPRYVGGHFMAVP